MRQLYSSIGSNPPVMIRCSDSQALPYTSQYLDPTLIGFEVSHHIKVRLIRDPRNILESALTTQGCAEWRWDLDGIPVGVH